MSNLKQEVAKLELAGAKPSQIANSVGVSESYICQLAEDVTYQAILLRLQQTSAAEHHDTYRVIDNNYNRLENAFTDMLVENEEVVHAAMLSKPGLIVSYMKALNQSKRRSSGETGQAGIPEAGAVILKMPAFIISQSVEVQHNERNEVVQVDSTPLVAMTTDTLDREAADLKAEQIAKLSQPKLSGSVPLLTLEVD